MKKITNTSLQGLYLTFNTPTGLEDFYLRPKKVLTVPNSYTSLIVDNLAKKRLLRVEISQDAFDVEKSVEFPGKKSKYK